MFLCAHICIYTHTIHHTMYICMCTYFRVVAGMPGAILSQKPAVRIHEFRVKGFRPSLGLKALRFGVDTGDCIVRTRTSASSLCTYTRISTKSTRPSEPPPHIFARYCRQSIVRWLMRDSSKAGPSPKPKQQLRPMVRMESN